MLKLNIRPITQLIISFMLLFFINFLVKIFLLDTMQPEDILQSPIAYWLRAFNNSFFVGILFCVIYQTLILRKK